MTTLFFIGSVSGGVLVSLLLLSVRGNGFSIWPVPMGTGLRSFVFWALFRCFNAASVLYLAARGVSAAGADGGIVPLLRSIGAFLAVLSGLLFAVAGLRLGRDALYGRGDGLETGGLYRFSRNPQYTAAIIGYGSGAVFAWSPAGTVLAGLAVAVYALMARAEEPWLTARYGVEFERYSSRVPRFFSVGTLLALGEAWSGAPTAFGPRPGRNRSAGRRSDAPRLSRSTIKTGKFASLRARVRPQARSGR